MISLYKRFGRKMVSKQFPQDENLAIQMIGAKDMNFKRLCL